MLADMVQVEWLQDTPRDVPSQNKRVGKGDTFDLPPEQADAWEQAGLVRKVTTAKPTAKPKTAKEGTVNDV